MKASSANYFATAAMLALVAVAGVFASGGGLQ